MTETEWRPQAKIDPERIKIGEGANDREKVKIVELGVYFQNILKLMDAYIYLSLES